MTAEAATRTVVASLDEARAAVAAARLRGVAAALESPPDAAITYGVLWFAELNRMLAREFPAGAFILVLDCGTRADLAHAALVEGIARIRFHGHAAARKALQDVASQRGAVVLDVESSSNASDDATSGLPRGAG